MRGIGDQVIRVPLDMLWLLMTGQNGETNGWKLPRSVDIIEVMDQRNERNPWIPDERDGPCAYLRIQHKYCFRRSAGSALCIENYCDFIERFNSIAKSEIQ